MSTTNHNNNHNQHHHPTSRAPSGTTPSNKNRQYAHLHAQLAQLNAHLADTENLVRMTAVQAQDMRFLGAYVGAMFMGSARVLGEESVVRAESRQDGDGGGQGSGKGA